MNRSHKPTYTGCPGHCFGGKDCWRANHIPLVGLLLHRYTTQVAVFRVVFKRWMRRKKIAWPDEVDAFWELYKTKHPELTSNAAAHEAWRFGLAGAVLLDDYWPVRLFYDVLDGQPFSPKPAERDKHLFKLAASTLKNLSVQGQQNELRNH